MNSNKWVHVGLALVCATAFGIAGCKTHMPHSMTWPAGGDMQRTHGKPPEGGYYKDWDPYSATLEVEPLTETNPVGSQHVLIATVKDEDGNPLPNRRVEWIIPEGKSVGGFVEVDESGWRASRGYKVNPRFAVTHTNNFDHTLTRGNDDPADDVELMKGQTWAVITSAEEGVTHVIAYAPGIYDWSKHKVFVKKHWRDVAYEWPAAAVNPVGTDHKFVTKVKKNSDGSPLQGYHVTYRVVDGPAAKLNGGGQEKTVKTDAQGNATVTLTQAKPVEGTNRIKIDVMRPGDQACCEEPVQLASGETTKRWIGPEIAITKTAPARALVGETFQYNIRVTNPSDVTAKNVQLTDTLPAGISFVSSNPKAQVSGQKLTWNLGSLGGGESVTGTVDVKATRTGEFRNCAIVTASPDLRAEDCATTVVAKPALALTKSGPDEVLICDPIEYTLVVTNDGDADAQNVKVVDRLPEGLTWKGERGVSFDVGTLPAGESRTMRYSATAARTGTFNNTANATADGLSAEASHSVTVRQPVLSITKTGPAERFIDRNFTWNITVSNTGNVASENTTVVDTLPAGVTFVSASEGGQQSGRQITWNLGTLEPDASRNLSVTVRGDTMGEKTNMVSASGVCADEVTARATTEVIGIPAVLLEMVDENDPIMVGENEVYTITITNQGTKIDKNARIVCTLPEQLQFVSADGPTEHTVDGQTVSFAPIPEIAPKARATYRVTAKAVAAGNIRFKVSLTTDYLVEPVEETEATNLYAGQ